MFILLVGVFNRDSFGNMILNEFLFFNSNIAYFSTLQLPGPGAKELYLCYRGYLPTTTPDWEFLGDGTW